MKLWPRRTNNEPPQPGEADDSTLDSTADTSSEGSSDDSGNARGSSGSVEWTGPAAWITKSISVGLVSCLIAGPCALALAAWLILSATNSPAPPPVVASEAESVNERAAVEAFASDFVVTWLTTTSGQEKRLTPYLAGLSGVTLPDQPWHVQDTAPAGIVESHGTWSVTVAATVAESDSAPAIRRYFRVPIVYNGGAMVAQTLPAPVAEPQQATAPELAYRFQAGLDDPIAAAAGEFLTALLVGGDVTRVISPDAQIRALNPPPYTSVELDDVRAAEDLTDLAEEALSDGEQLQLLVTAAATPAAETSTVTVQYALTMTARAGRWEVSALDATPALAPSDPASDPAGSSVSDPPSASPTLAPSTASATAPSSDTGN